MVQSRVWRLEIFWYSSAPPHHHTLTLLTYSHLYLCIGYAYRQVWWYLTFTCVCCKHAILYSSSTSSNTYSHTTAAANHNGAYRHSVSHSMMISRWTRSPTHSHNLIYYAINWMFLIDCIVTCDVVYCTLSSQLHRWGGVETRVLNVNPNHVIHDDRDDVTRSYLFICFYDDHIYLFII